MSSKLDSVLSKIKKTYSVEIPNAREAGVVEKLPLDSPSLNYLLGGGLPLGRMIYLQGPESGGKSSISTYLATQVQKKYTGKNTVIYFDYEYSADANHMEEMGLDVDNNFVLVRPSNGEDGFNMMRDFTETGEVGLIIIDSITSMASKSSCEDAFSGFAGGKTAAMIASGIRMLLPYLYNNKCTLVIISQERMSMSMFGADYKGTGGKAPSFYSTWSARITRAGDLVGPSKDLVGLDIKVRNFKNKVAVPKREAQLKLYFNKGIDSEEEYINYLKQLGLVTQKGAYYSNEEWISDEGELGFKGCGLDSVKEYLAKNPNLYSQIKNQVNKMLSSHNIIDETTPESEEKEEVDEFLEG